MIWIDSLGNLREDGDYIGYYDAIIEKCFLLNGTEVPCPVVDTAVKQPTVKGGQTYWWLFLVFFCIAVIVLAWWLNRKK